MLEDDMGFVRGMVSGLYRYTLDGERVYQLRSIAPRRRRPAYLVSDSLVAGFERRMRRLIQLYFFVVIPVFAGGLPTFLRVPLDDRWIWWILLGALMAAANYLAIRLWVLRGVPRVFLAQSDLRSVDDRAQELAQAQATGLSSTAGLFVASLVMGIMQVMSFIEGHYWWSVLGTGLFGVTTLFTGRQVHLLFKSQRAASSSIAS